MHDDADARFSRRRLFRIELLRDRIGHLVRVQTDAVKLILAVELTGVSARRSAHTNSDSGGAKRNDKIARQRPTNRNDIGNNYNGGKNECMEAYMLPFA